MHTKHITLGELYATIPEESDIAELFARGITIKNDRLAVSALEELIRRDALDCIIRELDWAFKHNNMLSQSNTVSFIASVLRDDCRGLDPLLCRYGRYLFVGEYVGPTQWLEEHLDDIPNALLANPKPWAKRCLDSAFTSPFDDVETAREWASGGSSIPVDFRTLPGNDR